MESLTGVVWSGCSPMWISVWESLAIRVRREHETVGSNPTMLTGWGRLCGVVQRYDGSLLMSTMQVRLLPPQLLGKSSGRMRGPFRKRVRGADPRCGFKSHGFRWRGMLNVRWAGRHRHQSSKLDRRVRFPQRAWGESRRGAGSNGERCGMF